MPYKIGPAVRLIALLIGFLLTGCANQEFRQIPPPVYPPPPEEPRFIYDGTLRTSHDVTEPTFGQKLQAFATGASIDPDGLGKPYGIAVKNGRIFVSDTAQRAIVMFDIAQRKYKIFGQDGKGTLLKPMGLDISPENELFVIDITAKRVAIFDWNGNYLRGFGDDRRFERPSGLALSPDGSKLYVSDTGGIESDRHRIHVLDAKTGAYLEAIGTRGIEPGKFNLPLQITTTADGKIYVVDSGNFRVQGFNKDGSFSHTFGSAGRRTGQFSRPKGIGADLNGNIYVVDTAFGNFQIFNSQGELLTFIGERGSAGGPGRFMLPAGIDIDENGRIYVVDQFFRKIEIFRPAHLPALENIPKF